MARPLKDEIIGGAKVDLLRPPTLSIRSALSGKEKRAGVQFARNRLCALVKPGLEVNSASLLERMLDPQIKLGTSTPKADPSGDYAFEVFRKAEAIETGAQATLEKKALRLTGGPSSSQPAPGRMIYGVLVMQGAADIFLTYCTKALVAQKENPGQHVVTLPDMLAVDADYGLTVMITSSAAAQQLAEFIVSPARQKILVSHGFASGTQR